MLSLEQVSEVKSKITSLKDNLCKTLHEVALLDNFIIGNKETLSKEEASKIRKTLSRLKPVTAHKFSNIILFLENALNKEDSK